MAKRSREFTVVIEKDADGYFVGTCPALAGCHTQAKSLDPLMRRMREVILLCLEAEGSGPDKSLELVGVQRLSL